VRRSFLGAVGVTALLALYLSAAAGRAVALIRSGEPVALVLGIAIGVLPLLVAWFILREWRLAATVQRMADELHARGDLPVDDLPRSPGGRIDQTAALAAFELARTAVENGPDSWGRWYHLAFAYDAARDRRRARECLRRAAALFRGGDR
jgi:hypothetical protein